MKEQFSVLLSVYYKENPLWFSDALKSIWDKQSLRPNQIVLVKDGPLTTALDNVISDFSVRCPVLTIVSLGENGGLGNALNIGIRHCKYEIVARMDTDDISHTDRFEKQVDFMTTHVDVDVMSSWIQEFTIQDGQRVNGKIKKIPRTHGTLYKYGKLRCPINHPACVYRKAKVISSGGYGIFPEDYYLWSRMMVSGCKFYNMQECLLDFRVSSNVFKRRGGWSYFTAEYKCQKYMWRIGYLSFFNFIRNCSIRFFVRIVPNALRTKIYKEFIRR